MLNALAFADENHRFLIKKKRKKGKDKKEKNLLDSHLFFMQLYPLEITWKTGKYGVLNGHFVSVGKRQLQQLSGSLMYF